MSLNAEPSQPEERAEHNLPPKSYAAAAEEALENEPAPGPDPQSHENQTDDAGEDAKENLSKESQDGGHESQPDSPPNGTKILRIVPAEEYEGEGQDDSPKSPERNAHRRKSSVGRKHGEQLQHEMFKKHKDGEGEPLTSVKPAAEFELDGRVDEKPMRRYSELQSGRQAGEGWHRSKYVNYHVPREAHGEWLQLARARATPDVVLDLATLDLAALDFAA